MEAILRQENDGEIDDNSENARGAGRYQSIDDTIVQ